MAAAVAAQATANAAQPGNATLTSLAALAGVADRVPYFTAASTLALATFTTFGRSLTAAASASAAKTLLSLVASDVGLSAVDNTSDLNKVVSTAQAAADALRLLLTGGNLTGVLNSNSQLFLTGTGNLRLGVGFGSGSFSSGNAAVEIKPHASTRFTFLDNVNGALHNPVLALSCLDATGKAMALYADTSASAFIFSSDASGAFDITSDTKANIQAGTFGGGTLRFRVAASGVATIPAGGQLLIGAGSTTVAPLRLTAGTNLTTPVSGVFEYDGSNLFFTVGGVRKTVTLF
jgi:hypothetical protein